MDAVGQNPKDVDATARFTDRVEDYVRFRPGYPDAVVETLSAETGLALGSVVVDAGSGTGISAELFLRHGCTVYAVEPNAAMRAAAERWLGERPRFHSIDGTAEATTLPARSADYVVAAQAFHWFDPPRARREFARVLMPAGWVVLLWNTRLVDASPFLRGYEDLLLEFGTDYADAGHRDVDLERLRGFFGRDFEVRDFPNAQGLDLVQLRGRLRSASYVPAPGHPRHAPMIQALDALFHAHQRDGRVEFEYRTELFFGRIAG